MNDLTLRLGSNGVPGEWMRVIKGREMRRCKVKSKGGTLEGDLVS